MFLVALICISRHSCSSRRSAQTRQSGTLRLITLLAVAGVAAWWVPMLLEPGVRADPHAALAPVIGTVTLGVILTAPLRWPVHQAVVGALSAGAATCLLIFLAAQCTYLLAPTLAPNLGRVPGMSAAAEVAQNRVEAVDPYVAELLLGAGLGAVLMATATVSPRARRAEDHLHVG